MAKLNFGIADATEVAAASGYPVYEGPMPPAGVYRGKLKVVKVGKIGSGDNKGKSRLMTVVTIDDPKHPEYRGCPAFGGLNITEQGVPYVNQFLDSQTDGSDKATSAIRKAFWNTGPIVDDAKEHIKKIGRTNVNSPSGEIEVVVATTLGTYQGKTTVNVGQWLGLADGASASEEKAEVVDEDEDIDDDDIDDDGDIDDDDPYGDDE